MDSSPDWSPGGKKITFMSDRDGGPGIFDVYTMDADGSDPVRLTFNDRGDTVPAYAPDGKQIAFTSFRDGNAEIYRMRTDGSLQTLISNNLAIDAQPDWQPLKSRR